MKSETTLPYWLQAGTETCAECWHTHTVQVQVRCTGCDRGFCQHCVVMVRETHELLCRGCSEGEEG
jgi:hypothetical protein